MPAGRPSKFQTRFIREARLLASQGFTEPKIAEMFDVSLDTITEWKRVHPQFSLALKESRQDYDNRVEISLAERAMGYSHKDTDIRVIDGQIVKTEIIKYYPPDPTSCIFWLKNRQRQRWTDRTDLALQNPDGTPLVDKDALAVEVARKIMREQEKAKVKTPPDRVSLLSN